MLETETVQMGGFSVCHICLILLFWCLYCCLGKVGSMEAPGLNSSEDFNLSSPHSSEAQHNEFLPIRIKTSFIQSFEIRNENQERLIAVIEKAVSRVERILSVQRKNGTLLLKRSPCPVVWKPDSGPNVGRCARVRSNYKYEYCLDKFKIPNDHLEGLAVYNQSHVEPSRVFFPNGTGIPDADFILYITAQTTPRCLGRGSSVGAYASYCRQDDSGRPTAGQLNLCPRHVHSDRFDEKLTFMICLHELFHALGFSASLFDKYQDCSGGNCSRHHHRPFRPVLDVNRLVMPRVQAVAQRHFGCWDKGDFGGPIAHRGISATSHWDERLMHGSIMAASLDLPHLVAVDAITLAVFEDTGWYKVDYSQADPFHWGEGQGCKFGLPQYCSNQTEFFCTDERRGCHYLHLDKAACSTSPDLQPCHIFQALPDEPCFKTRPSSMQEALHGEMFIPSSRCFMSNLTKKRERDSVMMEGGPRCYEHRCAAGALFVRPASSDWQECSPGHSLTFPDYVGELRCPDNVDVLCRALVVTNSTSTTMSSNPASVATTDGSVPVFPTTSSNKQSQNAESQIPTANRAVVLATDISWWLTEIAMATIIQSIVTSSCCVPELFL